MDDLQLQTTLIRKIIDLLKTKHQSEVTRIETHISTLLLAGKSAYKIKKPVNFGFLDFSSLTKRQHFCEEELRLNSRLAPKLYKRVIAITGDRQNPKFNGDGPALEYMLEMQRFAEGNEFNLLLEHGRLTTDDIDELAQLLARFHNDIQHADVNLEPAEPRHIAAACVQNFAQIEEHLSIIPEAQNTLLSNLKSWSENTLQSLQPVFNERLKNGFVRECHGDLHLGNITFFNDQLTVFDGIEFNEHFRWIDVISDIAFVLMDLHFNGRSDYAWRLLNTYLEQTDDYAGLQLLPFYMVYRAMVRAKVSVLRLTQLNDTDAEYAGILENFTQHLQLAMQLAQHNSRFLTITHGPSGSGKSYLSAIAMEKPGAIRLRSDIERQRINTDIENRYSKQSRNAVYELMLNKASAILDCGFSVILDATFLHSQNRQEALQLARDKQLQFFILDAECDVEEMEKRIVNRARLNADPSEADVSVLHQQLDHRDELNDIEQQYVLKDPAEIVIIE